MVKYCCLFVILTFISIHPGNGQSYHFRHLTIEDGLSQSTINCIFQDKNGYMWFGTQDGLNKYDGYEIEVLRNDPGDTNSISHSWIWDVFEDSQSNLWIATWQGLNKYDPKEISITRFLADPNKPKNIQGERPTSICEDKDGYIWIGTWGGGLNRYDPQTNTFLHFRFVSNENGIADDFVRKIYLDSKQKLWIGTWNGLTCVSKDPNGNYNFKNYLYNPSDPNSISSNQITCITEDNNGNMWFGTYGGGINKLDSKKDSFTRFQHKTQIQDGLSSNNISSIFEDMKGNLWVGTISEGLNLFDKTSETFIKILHNPDDETSLSGNNVYSIYEDKSGLLWIGAGGLNIYNRNQNQFKHYNHNPNDQASLSNNKIASFIEDAHGDIWIGTENSGINRYETRKNVFTPFKYDPNDPFSLSSDNISSLVTDPNGDLWIATRGGGINKYNSISGKFHHLKESVLLPESDGMNYINGIRIDTLWNMWLATYDRGLIKYNIKSKQYKKFISNPDDSTSISGNYLLRVFLDSKERVWIGSWGGGLSLYDSYNNNFRRFLHDPNVPGSICGNIIHCIYETNDATSKTLWVGTSNGLSYMSIEDSITGIFNHLYIKDGLPSNIIYGMLEDNSGNLWISTNYGICKFNPKASSFKNYDYKDGLQSNEFNAGAYLKLKSGELLFGGINGFNSFFPDSIKESDFAPPVVIKSFNLFDQKQELAALVDSSHKIKLSFRQNFFSFEFAALDFSQPSNNKYMYLLEGVDKEWIDANTRRYVSYTNIDPGNYVFRVRGTNSDGVWSPNEASLRINITPPYWRKVWFQVLVVLAVALTLYTLHRYRIRRLLEIERLRIRIASDLHDEIGSSLTRIAIHSEQIQSSRDENRIVVSSKKIGSISREVISTMSDIVWSIDARNDSMNDLLERIYDFTHNTLSVQDVKVSIVQKGLDKSKKIKVNYRQNIYYILKEAINNIVKHASATEVNISIFNDEKFFTMQISDNGNGFDTSENKSGHGLKNMQMRAERIDGKLTISALNGTHIHFIMNKL